MYAMDLSLDDIQQLSPDDASLKAAKGLVVPAKWPLLGVSDQALWGECQGSGSKPYQVQVDKSGPAFKCSCPSRKFPCKHGLALLFLHLQQADKFSTSDAPAWVSDWINLRQEKAEKQVAKKSEASAAASDPSVSAKREKLREERMLSGLEELELWLKDQIRQGLAQLKSQPQIGNQLAKRMVDAQLPGLANRMRQWEQIFYRSSDWAEKMLAEFGQLQLLIDAVRQIDKLPADVQTDLRSALGITVDKEWVLHHGERLRDDWLIAGIRIYEEDRLWVRRVWLIGKTSQRVAMLLDFSHGTRQFEPVFLSGTCSVMSLAFYPGNNPLRALVVDKPAATVSHFPAPCTPRQSLQQLTDQQAKNPWQDIRHIMPGNCLPVWKDEQWVLLADQQVQFELDIHNEDAWQLLAESGGQPLQCFGEWQNNRLRLLGAWRERWIWSEGSYRL